jgi:diguanylate cyclase (GGDEF)-like protein/PAS domain S-box-containing protein
MSWTCLRMMQKSALKNSRIMVVEDDNSIALFLSAMLEKEACIVTQYGSAEEALAAFPGFEPHLVLMDINLEGMDGFEATQKIQELSEQRTPVLIITGQSDTESIERGFQVGACDYIPKPIHWPLLKNRIDSILRRKFSEERNERLDVRFRSLFEHSPMGIILMDLHGRIEEANRSASDICQIPGNDLLNMDCAELMHEVSRDTIRTGIQKLLNNIEIKIVEEVIMRTGDSGEFCANISLSLTRDSKGQPTYVVLMFDDITQRKRDESRLRLAARVFENATEGIMVTDPEGRILDVNESFTRLTEYSREDVLGKNPSVLQSGRQDQEFYEKMWNDITMDGRWTGEIWNRRKGGEVYPEKLSINAVTDDSGKVVNYVAVFSDISGIKESEQRLKYLAYHDPLTGLANRILFQDRVKHAVESADRNGNKVALLYIDLDHFKTINDTMGHDVGDMLLEYVAYRLKGCVRESDTVARLGGDEFTVLLEQLHDRDDVMRVAECILNKMTETFSIANKSIRIGASIGISCYPHDSLNMESLIRLADSAMYYAKQEGKNRIVFFQDEKDLKRYAASVK